MKEVNKPNDIFVSTILNPEADISDLIANGINGSNTELLYPEEYKKSKFVQNTFTDEKGVFNDQAFQNAYALATQKQMDLQSVKNYNDLNDYAKYSPTDIFAPINSNKTDIDYTLKTVKNPFMTSEGVTSLFDKGEATKSKRELAQQHKVWDSVNEKWLDYTAEDSGFLGLKYLFGQSLVYATWDSDGFHFDKSLGREVKHKKGEWRTDENGMFFTETIGNRQGYGKEYVAFSDVLTKEDSWANKLDFFDSDDLKKSKIGTILKTAAVITPYLIPVVRDIWGGVTAAVGLATVMPTFAKMAEGVALGDVDTGFTRRMNTLENYWKKFGNSTSDEGKQSMINFETLMGTVGDIFGQLYQMRAAASLSNLYFKQMNTAQKASAEAFAKKFGNQWEVMKKANPKIFEQNPNAFVDLWKDLASKTPEMKAIIEKQSDLSRALSLGYMALTSSADVYEDAIQGGYDRRMAGIAGLAATAGQYAIMRNNKLGTWFLDATTGYKENVSRNVMRQTLRPYYDKINATAQKLVIETNKEAKLGAVASLFNTIFKDMPRKYFDIIKYGGEEFWKRALIEGTEEVTEEAVMDMTKGVFDILSSLGVGKNASTASFGGWENTFSSEGAQRYLMNFIGGLMGGALFEFQGKVIQPKMDAIISGKAAPEVRYSIVQEIMNGNTEELLKEIDRMTKNDNELISLTANKDTSTNDQITRGQLINSTLKNYIKFVEGIINDNGIKIENNQLLEKVVRDRMLQPVIEQSGLMDMIEADFTKMVDELVGLNAQLGNVNVNVTEDKQKNGENKEEYTVNSSQIDELKQKISNKKQQIVDFLNGKNTKDYLRLALIYLQPSLRTAALGIDKYSWTKSVYGVDYSTLPQTEATLSKDQIDKEYSEWKEKSDELEKFRYIGTNAFDELEKEFSPILEEYAKSKYKDVRKVTVESLLRDVNFNIGNLIQDPDWRRKLLLISQKLHEAGLEGINLEDKLEISDSFKEKIKQQLISINSDYFEKAAKVLQEFAKREHSIWESLPEEVRKSMPEPEITAITEEDTRNLFEKRIKQELQNLPVEQLSADILNNILVEANTEFANAFVQSILNQLGDQADNASLKQAIDTEFVKMGISPEQGEFNGDPVLSAVQYVAERTINPVNENFNPSETLLNSYFEKQDLIDNEVVRQIKSSILQVLQTKKQDFFDAVDTVDEGLEVVDENGNSVLVKYKLKDKNTAFEQFIARVSQGFDNNESLKDIISDALLNPVTGIVDLESASYKTLLQVNPNANNEVINAVTELINSIPGASLYETARNKNSKENPLFEKLRQFGMKVFDGDDMILFDLLESESNHMSQLPDLAEYIRQGITKEAIDNFIQKLELLKAITIGMEDTNIDPDHQIAFNIQMKRFAEKWDEGKDADKYKTISTENVVSILTDLDLLVNKLIFAKTLIETNTESKDKANKETKVKFEKILLNTIEKAGTLTIKGVSIFTPINQLENIESDSEKLGIIEHEIYTSIQQLLKNGEKIEEILDELFQKFEVNRETILNQGLHSNGLNSSIKTVSPYDFFVWLVTTASSDSNEFLYKYKTILKRDNYKHVPFFIQEYAAKTLYAFINDKSKVHNTAVQWLYNDIKNAPLQDASHIFFLNGIAGSGKSTAVMSLIASMINTEDIIIAAPNKSPQADNFARSLSTNANIPDTIPVLGKQDLLSRFFTQEFLDRLDEDSKESVLEQIKLEDGSSIYRAKIVDGDLKQLKIEDIPSVIFIDEATHFNLIELKALDFLAKKYNIKIVTAGDTLQKGATINGQSSNINDIFTWKSPAMLISVRASNIHKKDNTDRLQSILRQIESVFVNRGYNPRDPEVSQLLDSTKELTYYQTSSVLHGDKLVSDITLDDLKVIKAANSTSIAVIDHLDNNGQPSAELVTKLKNAGITNYTVYSIDDFSDKAVQGAEADYVIINSMPPLTMDNYQNLVNLYTYLTRSQIGSLVKIGDYKKQLNLVNNPIPYTSDYAMPGIDQQTNKKQERIAEIDSIIKDYRPDESKPETKIPETKSVNKPEIKESELSDEEISEINSIVAEGEATSTPDDLEVLNPIKWIPDTLYGYSFYNRTGISKDAHGRFFSRNLGTSMDLDGLFGDNNRSVSKRTIRGFIKFKNLVALHGTDLDIIKECLDNDILYFFYKVNPGITESTDEEDALNDVKTWLINHLQISDDIYVFAKKYNKDTDATALTPEGDADVLKDGKDLWVGFGRKLTITDDNGNIVVNQYITTGVLPKKASLSKWNIVSPEYDAFLQKAEEAVSKSGKTEIFVLPKGTNLETTIGLEVRKADDSNRFVTLRAMQDDQGIFIEQNTNGEPNVMLIDNNQSTINGVTTFNILHKIALTEESPISYAERIEKLKQVFVKDGKLTISGKYFIIAGFTAANDLKYKRVLILEPSGYTYRDALHFQSDLSHQIYDDDGDQQKKVNVLERKATAMSQASQMRLLTAMFKALNCIDENGLVIGDGVLPFVEYTIDYLDAKFTDKTIPLKMKELVQKYRNQGLDFDMRFISDILRTTRYGGVILIDQHLAVGKDTITVKQLPVGSEKRTTVDIDFDFDSQSYKEYGADFTKSTTTVTTAEGTVELKFTNIQLTDNDYNQLGLSGHFLNMPKFNFTPEMISRARLLSQTEAQLKHSTIDYTNDILTEKEEKVTPTTESFKELKKNFNPEVDIRHALPGARFYHQVRMTKEEAESRRKFTTSVKETNGFQIRIGDTIQIYGDTTHTYRISWVDKKSKKFEYDKKDGKEIGTLKTDRYIPFDAVSAIVGREVGKFFMTKDSDYYSSDAWKKIINTEKTSRTKASRIISESNLSDAKIEELLKKNPALVIYPVVNSDATVLTKLQTAEESLEDGMDLTSVGVYLVTSVEGVRETINSLSETEDLNGIVIACLFEDSVNKFTTNRKEVIKGITEGYIKQYISYTDSPKYIEVVKPKPTEITKPKIEKQKSRLEQVIDSINNTASLEILSEIAEDSIEALSDFSKNSWFKYLGEDNKWHVAPKRKLIDSLSDSIKSTILATFPKVPLAIGEQIKVIKDDGNGEMLYTLSSIEEDSYKFTYQSGDKTYPSSVNKSDFEVLFGKKFFKTGIITEYDQEQIKVKNTELSIPYSLNRMFQRFQENYQALAEEFITNSQRIFIGLQNVRANTTKQQVDTTLADFQILAIQRLGKLENAKELWSIESDEDLNTMIEEINYILSHNDQITDLYDENMNRTLDC